jgi:hypothetical protein
MSSSTSTVSSKALVWMTLEKEMSWRARDFWAIIWAWYSMLAD